MEPQTNSSNSQPAPELPPLLDRPRPHREPLVPQWLLYSLGALAVMIVLAVAAALLLGRGGGIAVPRIVGIDVGVARTRLAQQGLELAISEKRFSSLPADTVLEQTPAPGVELKRGAPVTVVVSAGSEDFAMPDLVGTGLAYARGQLEGKGLEVRVQSEPSEQTSGTVLASNPAARSSMRTGDIVTLTVATTGVGSSILLPTSMQGVIVSLDPAPVAAGKPDVTLDVARRVRSLLEASGATVLTTRALADTGTAVSVDERVKRVKSSPSQVAIGLEVSAQGKGSISVLTPVTGPLVTPSAKLASEIASAFVSSGVGATVGTTPGDKILSAASAPYSRISLGSFAVREDAAAFADPGWADRIARAIYRALAVTYGRTEPTP